MKKFLATAVLIVCSAWIAQSQPVDDGLLKELIGLGDSILRGKSDEARQQANVRFAAGLKSLLSDKKSFFRNLDSLHNLSVLRSPDGSVGVYTWLLPLYESDYAYFGFVQVRDRKSGDVFLLELQEGTLDRATAEKSAVDYKRWIGALYYDLVAVKDRPQPYYTLLGWRGNGMKSTMKVIDVLTIDNGKAVFGKPVFETGKGYRHRILFEYNPQAVMTLQFNPRKNRIVFDHLSAPDSSLAGIFSSYGPDFTYDAFKLSGKKWKLLTNVEARNRTGRKTNPEATEFRNKEFYRPPQD